MTQYTTHDKNDKMWDPDNMSSYHDRQVLSWYPTWEAIDILLILAVIFSGTRTTTKAITQIRDSNIENGRRKTTNLYVTYFRCNSTQIGYGKKNNRNQERMRKI